MARSTIFAVVVCLVPFAANGADDDVAAQAFRQRQAQAETDLVVHRMQTLIRVLDFYQAGDSSQKQAMAEMSKTLGSLSKVQMNDVLRRLDAAAKAPEGDAAPELAAAHAKHQEILAAIKAMIDRFDGATTIDQAAERFEQLGKAQAKLFATNIHPDFSALQRCVVELHAATKREWLDEQRYGKRYNTEFIDTGWAAFEQSELQKDVTQLLKQIAEMTPSLPEAQQRRVAQMNDFTTRLGVVTKLELSVAKLQPLKEWKVAIGGKDVKIVPAMPEKRARDQAAGVELQGELAVHYLEMSRTLKLPANPLSRLMAARERVDEALRRQTEINAATRPFVVERPAIEIAPMPSLFDPTRELIKVEPAKVGKTAQEQAAEKTQQLALDRTFRDLSAKELTAIYGVMDAENLLPPNAADVVEVLVGARAEMAMARDAVAKKNATVATGPQTRAAIELKRARDEIEKRISRAESAKTDTLAALEAAAEKLDAIIAAQKKNREATDRVVKDPAQETRLPALAAKELEILKETVLLSRTPLPGKEKFGPAIVKAGRQMQGAVKDLAATLASPALGKEDKAIEFLLEARKELAEKIAEAAKTREDIAKLEKAAEKLEKLKGQEKDLADKGDKSPTNDANKQLANRQKELTPPTQELAKDVQSLVPPAADKINASTADMQNAQANFEKNDSKPASKDAAEAVKKLAAAQKDVAEALDKLKAKELADQAALMPKSMEAKDLASQLAKALDQTQKAAEEAAKAEAIAKKQGDLTNQQKQIAKDAEAKMLPDVAKLADKAADALDKGKLDEALKAQKEALEKLPMPPPNSSDGNQSSAPHEPTPGDQKKIAPNLPPPPPMDMEKKEREPLDKELPPPQASAPKAISDKAIKEIVDKQQELFDETDALKKSKDATDLALAALAQAQAQTPTALQEQLQQAANQLAQAAQDLQGASPGSALAAQSLAASALQRALNTLNITLGVVEAGEPMEYQLQETPDATPVDEAGKGDPTKMSNSPSVIPDKIGPEDKNDLGGTGGIRAAKGPPGEEKNDAKGDGDREPDGKVSNAGSRLEKVEGDSRYLHLPPRQREMIRQAMSGNLPPEYAAAIQQYYANISRGQPATGR